MNMYWISCRSLTNAQRAARVLERSGYTASVAKAPQGLNEKGCSYAVTIRKKPEEALRLLREKKIPFGKLYYRSDDGSVKEAMI